MSDQPPASEDKKFFLRPDQIERLIEDEGACLATDRIVVDGAPVGYLYREPAGAEVDTGWRVLAGDESSEYMADPSNVGVYALNSIANHDQSIIALLDSPIGSAFAREEPDGPLLAIAADPEAESAHAGLHPDYPVVSGDYRLTQYWGVTLPQPCNRRIEDGTMVLWRPGLTIHVVAWDNTTDASMEDRIEQLVESVPEEAVVVARTQDEKVHRFTYASGPATTAAPEGTEEAAAEADGASDVEADGGETTPVELDALNGFVVCAEAQLLASVYYDDEAAHGLAMEIIESLALVPEDQINPG